jgi:hypothetical protein
VFRALAPARTLATACFVGLGVSSCSWALDWNGYTDGGFGSIDAADDAGGGTDARAATDANDAADARDSAGNDAAPDVVDAEGSEAATRCGPFTCGGCCRADGFCAGGGSEATCGTAGGACQDCTRTGQSCDQGVCASVDSGPAPVCDEMQCRSMLTLCIPVEESPCCRSDGTCGCQVQIPPMTSCM